ncbi:MAG: T9SS type A sorting domain-containing protein [Bacteroidota bacterium]
MKILTKAVFAWLFFPAFITQPLSAQLTAVAGPDVDFCDGTTVQLNGSCTGATGTCTYQWTPSTGLSDPNIANPIANLTSPLCYTLTVFENGQPGITDDVCLKPHSIPTVDAGPDREICLGDSIMLDGEASGDSTASYYTFAWMPSATLDDDTLEDPTAFPFQTTTYYTTATSDWGCQSALDSVTVFLKPSPQADAGPSVTLCDGDSAILFGSHFWGTTTTGDPNLLQFSWQPGASLSDSTVSNPVASPTTTTWYYLTVAFQTCSHTDSVLVTVQPPLNPMITQNGNVLTGSGGFGGASYQWLANGFPINGANGPTYTISDTACYQLLLIEGGCSETSDSLCTTVGVPEIAGLRDLQVFPNPFVEAAELQMELEKGMMLDLKLLDLHGRTVWQQTNKQFVPGQNRVRVQPGPLPAGLYLLQVRSATGQHVVRLEKR